MELGPPVSGLQLTPTNYDYSKEKKWLAAATINDARHDIEYLKTQLVGIIKTAFLKGIPTVNNPEHIGDEWEVLNSVLHSCNDDDTYKTSFKQLIQGTVGIIIPDVTHISVDQVIPLHLKIGIPKNPNQNPKTPTGGFAFTRNYQATKFIIKSSANGDLRHLEDDSNIGEIFCTNTSLLGEQNDAIFVVDFNQNGFLSQLKMGGWDVARKIYVVTTPEIVNDPASKTRHDEKLLYATQTGINLISLVQKGAEDMFYSKFDDADVSPNNNFFSSMEFILSPILSNYATKNVRLYTNVNVGYRDGDDSFFCDLPDSKYGNSNEEVSTEIIKICNELNPANRDFKKKIFEFNVNVQRKRAGDWWQALCCLMIYQRTFYDVFGNTSRPNLNLDSKTPCYFVTHDKIAAAYALAMGCNVIFIDKYGRVTVLKNMEDLAFQGVYVDPTIKMLERLKTEIQGGSFDILIGQMDEYIEQRRILLTDLKSVLHNNIKEFSSEFTVDDIPKNNFDLIKNVFRLAVELSFALKTLPDIEYNLEFVKTNKDGLDGQPSAELIFMYNKCYNSLVSVQRLVGSIPDMKNKLQFFVGKIKSQRVYTLISSLFSHTDDNAVDIRMVHSQNPPEIYPEKHSFLSFIQNLDDDLKAYMLEIINGKLTNTTFQYRDELDELTVGMFTRRGKSVSQNIRVNNIFNFILEARYFLYVSLDNLKEAEAAAAAAAAERAEPMDLLATTAELVEAQRAFKTAEQGEQSAINAQTTTELELNGIFNGVSDSTTSILVGSDFDELQRIASTNSFSDDEEEEEGSEKMEEQQVEQEVEPENIEVAVKDNSKTTRWSLMTGLLTNTNNYYSTFADWFSRQQRGGTIGLDGKLFKLDVNHDYLPPGLDINKILENPPVIDLKDVNFGYHPLLPLYMILSSFFYSIDPDILEDTFYDAYIKYYHLLCFMVDDIITQINQNKILQAYLIGFALKAFLFNPTLISDQPNDYYDVINRTFMESGYKIDINTNYDYRMMLLTNSSFSNYISGTIYVTNDEYNFEQTLFYLDIVKGFLIENYSKAYNPPLPRAPLPPPGSSSGPPLSPIRPADNTTSSLTPPYVTQASQSSELQYSASPQQVVQVESNCADLVLGASFNNLCEHIFKLMGRINTQIQKDTTPEDGPNLVLFSPDPGTGTVSGTGTGPGGLSSSRNLFGKSSGASSYTSFKQRIYSNLSGQIDMIDKSIVNNIVNIYGARKTDPTQDFLKIYSNIKSVRERLVNQGDVVDDKKLEFALSRVLTGTVDDIIGKYYEDDTVEGGKRKTRKQKHRKTTKTTRKQVRKGAKKTRKRRKPRNNKKSKRR